MGDLPKERVTPALPFETCGVDYAGPFVLRERRIRGNKTYKGYTCIFVCFITKALHIEIVTSLSSECFLAALKRFIARRGKPRKIFSDNGTAFVGANREIQELHEFLQNQSNVIQNFASNEGILWSFIPARSPHFGGIWEAGVKSLKTHLKRVIGTKTLTYEAFETLLTQIEATLNSRPLSPLSDDPSDLNPLTPAHFLIGKSLTALPEENLQDVPASRLSYYQQIQQMYQHFWQRWHHEYLHGLQQRPKWTNRPSIVSVGDMVILVDENQPPMRWRLGRITKLHPGNDNIVRVVSVKTVTGEVKRAVKKVCVLPINQD